MSLQQHIHLGPAIGKFEDAIPYYDKVIAIDPNNTVAISNKGDVLWRMGRYKEAIPYFDTVLKIDAKNKDIFDPSLTFALFNKGYSLMRLGADINLLRILCC